MTDNPRPLSDIRVLDFSTTMLVLVATIGAIAIAHRQVAARRSA